MGIFLECCKSYKDSPYKNAHDTIYTKFLSKILEFYNRLEPVLGPQAKNLCISLMGFAQIQGPTTPMSTHESRQGLILSIYISDCKEN